MQLALPPQTQTVWRVIRSLLNQKIYRNNVMSSLRDKYGMETAQFAGNTPATDATATEMVWVFDEKWRPAQLMSTNSPLTDLETCIGTFGVTGLGGSWFAPGNIQRIGPQTDDSGWCNTSMRGVVAKFGPGEIINSLDVVIIDMPRIMSSARAELAWLADQSKSDQKKQLDQSRQVKPKL